MVTNSIIRFQEIFEGSTEGIILINKEGTIVAANPSSARIFHYNDGELIGKHLDILLPGRFRDRHAVFREQFTQNPVPRSMGAGRDLRGLRKDGTEFPVEVSLSHTESDGNFLVMAFIIDITQRKKAEDALKQSEEQLIVYATELERKVESRTQALNESIQKLEQEVQERKKAEAEVRKSLERERELNELKTKFVSIASHEFRTPLSTILSSAALIQQYKDRGEFDMQEKHVLRIKSSVNHLTGILNDFLSLGKLEEGKVDVTPEALELTSFLNDVREEMRPSLKDQQRIEITCPTITLQIDPRILRNILFNLLSNASKYSEPGRLIWLSACLANTVLSITVRDEGMGIPEADKRHLIERFFRASNATAIQGTGLGLHIVKRYADLLGGELSFISQERKGSSFIIKLPV